jgi:hypothetical protein
LKMSCPNPHHSQPPDLPGLDLIRLFRTFNSVPEYKQLFQNQVTQHTEVVPGRIIFDSGSDPRKIMRLLPTENPHITLKDMGYAMRRQQSSIDIVMVGYA